MIPEIGHFALILALAVAMVQGTLPLVGRRVLVVDDNATNRAVLRHYLTAWGVESEEVPDGLQSLACLRTAVAAGRPYELALLDHQMPEMDGFEFVVELRSRPEWCEIPVVVITAKDLSAQERERLNGGVTRVLQKGASDMEALLQEIGRRLPAVVERALGLAEDGYSNFAPGFAIACCNHETQYTRLFRS